MFRRKDEENQNLFNSGADAGQAAPAETTATVAASASAPASTATAPTTPAPSATTATPIPSAPRSGFRSSGLGSELTRNRMPEAKAPTAAAVTTEKASKGGAPRRVLTVGNDILLKGEIATCDRLVIEGKVDATLNEVHTVEIAETGSFKGSAHIEDAEISGLFEGDLIVRGRLVIYATGKVRGKISYGEIEIERGGELTGEIKATSQPGASSATRPARPTVKQDDKVAA